MKKANDYKAWYRKNDPQNARKGFEEYNRPFEERYKRPPEYSKRPDAYQHYPERYDYTADQDAYQSEEKKRQDQQQNSSHAAKGRAAGKSIVRTVAGHAVAIVVGAIVLVSGYQALKAKSVPTFTTTWTWSEDCQSVTLRLVSEDKSIKKELDATVTLTEEVLATCVADGHRLYTASSAYQNVTYTDVHKVVLYAHGHHFDDGTVTDGHIEYTCSDCGEHVVVDIDVEEND